MGTIKELFKHFVLGVAWASIVPLSTISTYYAITDGTNPWPSVIAIFVIITYIFGMSQYILIKKYKNVKACLKAFSGIMGGMVYYSALYYLNKYRDISFVSNTEPFKMQYLHVMFFTMLSISEITKMNIIVKAVKTNNGRKIKKASWWTRKFKKEQE